MSGLKRLMKARRLAAGVLLFLTGGSWADAAWADSTGVLEPFPESGAFSATHREDRGAVSVIELSGNYDRSLGGRANIEPRAVVAREFFRTHADHYDFLVVFTAFEFNTGEAAAFHWRLQNRVQGIGLPQFDNAGLFGSGGQLKGYTDMAALGRWATDPVSPEFEEVLSVLGHEILHQWSGNVRFDQGGGPEGALLGHDGSHWSNLLDTDASVLYGHQWRDNGDGTFTSTAARKFFSPLDLYLAGLYGPEEVPPMTLIVNPAVDPALTPEQSLLRHGSTVDGTARTVTVDDVIAAEGPRVPAAADAQKRFRFAFILLTGQDQPVTERQVGAVDAVRRAFADRFSIWTGGRAIAEVFPEGTPAFSTGEPGVVEGGLPRVDPANLEEGFLWLRAQQAPGGFWRDKDATTLRDTAEVLDVLSRFDPDFARRGDALVWLGEHESPNTDSLARQALSYRQAGLAIPPALRDRLLGQQNVEGGWGFGAGFDSDPLDTALVLQALLDQPGASAATGAAADYLLGLQNADGGWGNRAGSPSRTGVTTKVVKALRAAGRLGPEAPAVVAFLAGRQNADGGFGDSPSTPHDTANVLALLTDLEALAGVRAADATGYLLARQADDGSWDGSTYTTARVLAALQRFNFTNWALGALTVEPAAPVDGDRLRLGVNVRNDTAVDAPATVLRFYDGPPGEGVQIGADVTVPALRAGQSVGLSVYWDTFGRAGTHALAAVVDPDDLTQETGENDNRADTAVTVEAAPAGVDLAVAPDDVAVMPASPASLPAELGFAATVRNLGQTGAAGVPVQLRAGAADGPVLAQRTVDIAGRGSAAVNFTYTLTEPGEHVFFVVVDPDDAVAEAREDNNRVQRTVTTQDSVDLAVAAGDISADATAAVVGDDIEFTVNLHNRGTVAAPSSQVRYLLTDGTTTAELATNAIQINAGQSIEQRIVWRADREGDFTFTVQLDPDNLLAERREDNNTASFTFSAGRAAGPNLVVSHRDFTFTPDPGLEARALTLTALVRNTGADPAGAFDVAFYNGHPDEGGVIIGAAQSVPGLAPDESATVSVEWPAVPDADEKLLFVVADAAGQVSESSDQDNRAFNTLDILSLADLAVSGGDITLSPAFPAAGDSVSAAVRVANLGQQAASGVVVRVFRGDPAFGGSQIGEDRAIDLPGNEAGVVTVDFSLPADGAPLEALFVQVDPDDAVLEQTELNNTASREFAVQDGDFAVSQRYISPDGDGVQDASELFFRLEQLTEAEVVVVDDQAAVVRHLNNNGFETLDQGRVLWDGLDDRGRVVRDGLYRLQVRGRDGTVLGEAAVTVDTNRLPLMRALGTPYGSYTNLTCQIPHRQGLKLADDDGAMVFLVPSDTDTLLHGVYRADGAGNNVRPLALNATFGPGTSLNNEVAVSDDLSRVAVRVSHVDGYQVWLVETDGQTRQRLNWDGRIINIIGFGPDNGSVVIRAGNAFYSLSADGGEPMLLAEFGSERVLARVSPDGRWLLLDVANSGGFPWRRLELIDLSGGTRTPILSEIGVNVSVTDDNFWRYSWSPDGTRLAVVNSYSQKVHLFSEKGTPLFTVPWAEHIDDAVAGNPEQLSEPVWSTVSNELAFAAGYQPPCCQTQGAEQGGLFLVDLDERTARELHRFETPILILLDNFGTDLMDAVIPTAYAQADEKPMPSPRFSDFLWAPNERGWIFRSSLEPFVHHVFAFSLDESDEPRVILEQFGNDENTSNFRFSPSGRQLLFDHYSGTEDGVCRPFIDHTIAFRSLLNLTADLRAVRSARTGGVVLSGTAADAHFSQYRLEYADADAPDTWRPVQPASGQEVVDGEFTVWVPPAAGTYLVRLTVTDKAGNQRRQVQRVSWGETPAITDLHRSPAMFSPNGDGVADVSTIQYRVLGPVHLEFRFHDAEGRPVRTIVRDHAEVGQTFQVAWDGRDDNGVVLADGEYTMTVQSYEFFFHIDATAPAVELELQDAYQPREVYDEATGALKGVFASAAPRIEWSINDLNYTDSEVEWSAAAGTDWRFFNDPDPGEKGDGLRTELELELSTTAGVADEVSGRRYRVAAGDKAGNRTVVEAGPVSEQLIVTAFGEHAPNPKLALALQAQDGDVSLDGYSDERDKLLAALRQAGGWYDGLFSVPYAAMDNPDGPERALSAVAGEVRFTIKETVASRFTGMQVQYRRPGETSWRNSAPLRYFDEAQPFSPTPVEHGSVGNVDAAFHIIWTPPAGLERGAAYAVRLRAVDGAGGEHFSNVLRAKFVESLTFEGLRRNAALTDIPLIDDLLGEKPAAGDYVLWGRVFSGVPFSTVRVFVSSGDDPRYAIEREVGVFNNAGSAYAVKTADLTSCRKYRARVVGRIEPHTDPQTGELLPARTLEVEGGFTVPCLKLAVDVQPVLAASCNTAPPQQLNIRFSPQSADGTALQLLALSTGDSQDVIFNVNEPAGVPATGTPLFNYNYILDTASMEAGPHTFQARLVNANDEEITVAVPLVVDRTPPAVSLGYPGPADTVCGVQREVTVEGQRETYNVLTLEGAVEDDSALGYVLEFNAGNGYDPAAARRFHDSNPMAELNSFAAAAAKPYAGDNSLAASQPAGPIEQPALGVNRQSGPLGELYNVDGEFLTRLRVYDWGGHQQCLDRVFTFDGQVQAGPVSVDRALFSPNGDGVLDELTVHYTLEESATLDIDVYAAEADPQGGRRITGDVLRRVESALAVPAGSGESVWDGSGETGDAVPDGLYGIQVTATDACGNRRQFTRFVEVDNTPPSAGIVFPEAGSPLSLIVEVQGTATDTHFSGYSLAYGAGAEPQTWSPVGGGSNPVGRPAVLAAWNTFGLQGEYTLRLLATDAAGNRSEQRLLLTLTGPPDLIASLEAVEPLFSPNGDGRRDSTAVRFGLQQPAVASLRIVQDGEVLRELLAGAPLEAGPHTVTWDGRAAGGAPAADGRYGVVLEAAPAADPATVQQVEQITVTVDGTPPAVLIDRPAGGFAGAGTAVLGTISDDTLQQYTVSLTDTPANPVWTDIATGNASLTDTVLARLDDGLEGDYALRVSAVDRAENRTERYVEFSIDNTAPRVTLTQPQNDSFVGGAAAVAVGGQIQEANPASYTVSFAALGADTSTAIASGENFPLPAVLAQWDVSGLADGVYELALEVTDLAGHTGTAYHLVTVDNTPPVAEIAAPAAGGWLRAGAAIEGTAGDDNLAEYRLEISPGDPASASQYSLLGGGATPVEDGALHTLDAAPPDGPYALRLSVEDRAGNLAQVQVPVSVDTTPPAAPAGVSATVENERDVALNWNAGAETDLEGYLVFRDGVQLTPEPVADPEYLDAALPPGSYTYTVRAVDRAGNRSGESLPVEAVVDTAAPTVRLGPPADGARVSALVEIRGTAYSADDFREYRLYVAPAETPDARQLLRRSPVPVQGDLLGEWNTVSLPEGAAYRITLEGEDINGNTATAQITVTVDNQPPARPAGLTAVVTGGDNVALAWDANTDADLLGYLVFRDGRIANAAGTAVGDLAPYAVGATAYDDLERPDGTYSYTVVAIDGAGNLSEASAPAEATINTRPPKASIVTPEDGLEFEQPLYVLAESEDNDLARVRFQYRADGAGVWSELETDDERPYDTDFAPAALGLSLGDYQLRAVATDVSGQIDPEPAMIAVAYRDLTAPAPVADLAAVVNGGDVTLSWTANTEADLDGYYIDRLDTEDNATRLTAEPWAGNAFVDSGVEDGAYRYAVTALDISGNASAAAEPVAAVVYTPALEPVISPTPQTAVTVQGRGVTPATVNATVASEAGLAELAPAQTDADGVFSVPAPLALNANTVTVRLTDPAGNTSKPAVLNVFRGEVPGRPTGLSGTANDTELSLSWDANPEPDIAGYRLYRNGEAVLADTEVPGVAAGASQDSIWSPASNVLDDDNSTYWVAPSPFEGHWIDLSWTEPRLVTALTLRWQSTSTALSHYDVQAQFRGDWITLVQVRGAAPEENQAIALPAPYMTTRVRLLIREQHLSRLSEMRVMHAPLIESTAYIAGEPDGVQSYTVTAVNELGFESESSDPAEVAVGDVIPPQAVTLDAQVDGSSVQLSWTASASADTVRYELYRDGEPLAQVTDLGALAYTDLGLANGTYAYTVVAVDARGNESAPSNEAVAAVEAPGSFELTVTAQPDGSALILNWAAPADITPTVYHLFRSTTAGGPYERIDTVTADTTGYDDTSLSNAVTYYYVVTALDQTGLQSATSVEAFGTPQDSAVPAAPVLSNPTTAGRVYISTEPSVTIGGIAEPATTVTLRHEGLPVAQTTAADEIALGAVTVPLGHGNPRSRVSPNGRRVASYVNGRVLLADFATGQAQVIADVGNVEFSVDPRWSPDGRQVLTIALDDGFAFLQAHRVDDGSTVALTDVEVSETYFGAWSPDGGRLALLGWYFPDVNERQGLWVKDLSTGERKLLVEGNWGWFRPDTVHWSPDGASIAYINTSTFPATVNVVDVESGEVTVVENTRRPHDLDWAPDGDELVYSAYDYSLGRYVAVLSSLETGESSVLATGESHRAWIPQFSPDGGSLAYSGSDGRLYLFNRSTGEERVIFEGGFWHFNEWGASGHLSLTVDAEAALLTLPGYFEFDNVPLSLGDNAFSAVAEDEAGNVSDPSGSIVVNYTRSNRPDLSVTAGDIRVLPATPSAGETARVGITVRNLGNSPSGPTVLSALAVGPSGESVGLLVSAPVGALAPGGAQTLSADWPVGAEPGEYTLVAVVDPDYLVDEISEINNTAIVPQLVSGDGGLALSLNTDAPSYPADSTVTLAMQIGNSGAAFNGRFEVAIEDGAGFNVTTLADEPVDALAFGEALARSLEWNTAATLAGDYRAVLNVFDGEGAPVDGIEAPFVVSGSAGVEVSVTTDRPRYPANTDVRITGGVRHSGGNAPFGDATARLRVVNSDGAVLDETVRALAALLPGESTAVTLDWNTALNPPGGYTVELAVLHSGEPAGEAAAAFEIENSGVLVNGELALSDEAPDLGEPVTAGFGIVNAGNAPVAQLPVTVSLVDPDSQSVVFSEPAIVDIDAGGRFDGTVPFNTAGLGLKAYNVVLQAELPDEVRTLAVARFTPADRVPPVVEVRAPQADGWINGAARTVFAAVDAHSGVDAVEYRVDGGPWRPARLQNAPAGEYGDDLPLLAEGGHTLEARATDGAGNTGFAGPVPFAVDNTAPSIDVDGVSDGSVLNTPVTPVVTVADPNLAGSAVFLNGVVFTPGTEIVAEGEYQLVVRAEDVAGNASRLEVVFAIDTTPPEIAVSGVEDGALVNEPVTPVIEVTDEYFTVQTALLDGEPFESGTLIDQDGVYELEVTAEDLAGNRASQTIGFEIDATAPAVIVTSPEDGALIEASAVDITGQTEAGATVVLERAGLENRSVLANANGRFTFSQVELAEGENELTFTATDRAGNTGEAVDWTLTRQVPPLAELDGRIGAGARVLIWAEEPGRSESVSRLTAVLDEAGLDHAVVDNEQDFLVQMRSRRYTVLMPVDLFSNGRGSNRPLKIAKAVSEEIAATVASGTGLVAVKTHPSDANSLPEVFGARAEGHLPHVDAVTLEDSPASRTGEWALHGDGVKLKVTHGTVAGWWDWHHHKHHGYKHRKAAMVINTHVDGRVALAGFDPMALVDEQARKDVLLDLLRFATPEQAALLPGAVVELQWQAGALSPPAAVQLQGGLPDTMEYLAVRHGDILTPTLAEWRAEIDAGEARFTATIRLPDTPGDFEIDAVLYEDRDGMLRELASGQLTITVPAGRETVENNLLETLDGLREHCDDNRHGKGGKHDKHGRSEDGHPWWWPRDKGDRPQGHPDPGECKDPDHRHGRSRKERDDDHDRDCRCEFDDTMRQAIERDNADVRDLARSIEDLVQAYLALRDRDIDGQEAVLSLAGQLLHLYQLRWFELNAAAGRPPQFQFTGVLAAPFWGNVYMWWSDEDPDSNAEISLYYDTDREGADGELIVDGIAEDPDGWADFYKWKPARGLYGEYFIYALIRDSYHSEVVYAPEAVVLKRWKGKNKHGDGSHDDRRPEKGRKHH